MARFTVFGNNFGDVLDRTTENYPKAEAIIYGKQMITYSQLKRKSDNLAKALIKLGMKAGDHIAIWMPNCPEWIYSMFAIAKIGGVIVPMNSRYKAFEVEYILKHSDAKALIMMDRFLDIDYMSILDSFCPEASRSKSGQLESASFPFLKNIIVLEGDESGGWFSFDKVMKMGEEAENSLLSQPVASLDQQNPAIMFYTSGTTGRPKGCLLSYGAIYFLCNNAAEIMGITNKDVVLATSPFFHMFGMHMHIIVSVIKGASQIVMDRFIAEDALSLIEGERVTIFNGIPTMFIMCFNLPDFGNYDLSCLRIGMVGGAPCPAEVMKRILDNKEGMGMEAINAYAQSESGGPITFTYAGDSIERRTLTVGKPIPEVNVEIRDPVTGQTVESGHPGEMCVKSEGNMLGYYKNPEATAETLRDGWLHTGDLAIADEGGYLRLTGRIADTMIVGGFNVYPREIEEFLFTHQKIKDVSVVGVPDHKFGEVPAAFIVLKNKQEMTAQELIDFCKEHVANFKIPKYVEFVDELPYIGVGKVQRFKLREIAIEKYSLK